MIKARRWLPRWLSVLSITAGLFLLGLGSVLIAMRLVIRGQEIKVPQLVGKDIVYALETLNTLGLGLKIADQQFDQSIPENHIVSQKPAGDSLIKKGRSVWVILSKGSQLVWTPQVAGNVLFLAQLDLKRQGLRTGQIIKVHNGLPVNEVLAQYPAGNSHQPRGSKVSLIVSEGEFPRRYIMPDLIGMSLPMATIKLKSLGLELGEIAVESYQDAQPQTIINQSPKSGYPVQAGEPVGLTVSGE